jgi:hypothetical protein
VRKIISSSDNYVSKLRQVQAQAPQVKMKKMMMMMMTTTTMMMNQVMMINLPPPTLMKNQSNLSTRWIR